MSDEHDVYTLHIEHSVPDYTVWKRAFDSDPVGRGRLGVRQHRVLRAADDPGYVTIELDFETRQEAETLLDAMRAVWGQVAGTLVAGPLASISERVELQDYRA